jgi:glycerol-3-phosphate acyltransferase PlsY
MMERDADGGIRLRGGAGGASCVGGSVGLWAPSILIIVPIGAIFLFFLGYASVATLSVALVSSVIFAYRAWIGASPWEYIFYGLFSFLLLAWSLRPNIKRLISGNERIVGWRARRGKAKRQNHNDKPGDSLGSINRPR